MKRRFAVILLTLLTAALLFGSASAAGGDTNDPLISLDYLQNVFAPAAEKAAQEKLDASGKAVYDAAEAKWRAAVAAVDASAGLERADTWTDARLKQGDTLAGVTGTQVILLAGGVSAQFPAGTVVDVTDGSELASGAALKARHRYLVAEDTAASFVVSSRTAVVDYCGGYHISASSSTPDYNAMASALKSLSLFRGTDTGYGEGFDLEKTPSRIEALVMLIRMLGEEDAALACAASNPFRDIPANYWGRPYVVYAYEMGYTNGVGDGKFAPDRPANTGMYVEFVLRALGYSDTTQTDVSTAADRALLAGVITTGERAALLSNDFLRADIAYLSWYALDVPLPDGTMALHEKLERAGVFSPVSYDNARLLVTTPRL